MVLPFICFAWAMLGYTHDLEVRWGFIKSFAESLKLGTQAAPNAQEIDDTLPEIHILWGTVYLFKGQLEKAIAAGQKAIEYKIFIWHFPTITDW